MKKIEDNILKFRSSYEKITTETWENSVYGHVATYAIYRSNDTILLLVEVKEHEPRLVACATTNFSGLLNGLEPGKSEEEVDRLLWEPGFITDRWRAYDVDMVDASIIVHFEDEAAKILEIRTPLSGGGEDEQKMEAMDTAFDDLVESLQKSSM